MSKDHKINNEYDFIEFNTHGMSKNSLYLIAMWLLLAIGFVLLSSEIYKMIIEKDIRLNLNIIVSSLFVIFGIIGMKKEHLLLKIYGDHLEIINKKNSDQIVLEKKDVKKLTFENYDEDDPESIITSNLFVAKKNGSLGRYKLFTVLSDEQKHDAFNSIKKSLEKRSYHIEIKDTYCEPDSSGNRQG